MGKSEPLLVVEPSGFSLFGVCFACLMCHIGAGYSLVVISPSFFYLPADISDFTTSVQGVAVFLYTVGAMVSSVTYATHRANFLSDRFGRRIALVVADLLMLLSIGVTVAAHQAVTLVIGRILSGAAAGFIVTLNPVYIAEMTPAKYRGACLSALTLAWLVAEAIALGISVALGSQWRVTIALGAIPVALHVLAVSCWLSESPRWLVAQGRESDALGVLEKLYRGEPTAIRNFLQPEIEGIKREIHQAKSLQLAQLFSELFSTYRRNFCYVCGYLILFQFSGLAGIMYFSAQVMSSVGFTSGDASNLAATVLFLIGAAACLLNVWVVDSFGRRIILLAVVPIQGVSVVIMAVGIYFKEFTSFSEPSKWICLTALLMYFFFVNFATAPLSGVIPPELFPQRLRSLACGLGYFTGWLAAATVGISFLFIVENRVGKVAVWGAFAVANIALWTITYKYLQETKGRVLEENTVAVPQ